MGVGGDSNKYLWECGFVCQSKGGWADSCARGPHLFFGKQTDGAISLVNEVTAAISNAGAKYFSATNDHECPFLTLLARKDPVGIFYVQQMV